MTGLRYLWDAGQAMVGEMDAAADGGSTFALAKLGKAAVFAYSRSGIGSGLKKQVETVNGFAIRGQWMLTQNGGLDVVPLVTTVRAFRLLRDPAPGYSPHPSCKSG